MGEKEAEENEQRKGKNQQEIWTVGTEQAAGINYCIVAKG